MQFLNEYGKLESVESESWAQALGVSAYCDLGSGVVYIVSLSAILFMFPFENISVSSFSPYDRKWASGPMAKTVAVVATGAVGAKTAAYGAASLSRVTGLLVAFSLDLSFIFLLLCFSVPFFGFR